MESDVMSDSDTTPQADPAAAPPVPDTATDPTPDRASDTPREPDPAAAPAPRSDRGGGGGGLMMVLGGAVAAVLGYGLAQIVPGGWPMPDTGALTAAQDDLTRRLAAAETALAASEARVTDLTGTVEALAQGVANLPAAPEPAPAPDLSPLQDRLAALETQLQGIASLPAGDGPANAALAGQIAALQAEVQRLAAAPPPAPAADTGAITAALAEAEAGAAALRRAAALDLIAAALQTGSPYDEALAALGGEVPAELSNPAAQGVPTEADLLAAFPDAARAVLAAVAAEEAQAGGWTDRAMAFLQMQTGARSVTAREGTTPDAILSRAEAALREGRLADAVAEVGALPPTAQAPMADWLAQAGTAQAARAALAALLGG
jgi:hypothetical protein